MTPERLEQIRRVIGDEPLPDWASKIFDRELLAEVDRLRAIVVEYDRAHLRCLMSNISEDYWCAGWNTSNETMLWRAITTEDRTVGLFDAALTEWEVAELKRLSESAGGWFAWGVDEDGEAGAQFVPMAEWLERYTREASE
jgi:hypothetical protein